MDASGKTQSWSLWLGQAASTPFQLDESITADKYAQNSTSMEWPIFTQTMGHRLHDIKTLCESCHKIDIATLKQGRTTVRDNYLDLHETASSCRLCALIAQGSRAKRESWRRGFKASVDSNDTGPDTALQLCMEVRENKLFVYVLHPESWKEFQYDTDAFEIGVYDLCSKSDNQELALGLLDNLKYDQSSGVDDQERYWHLKRELSDFINQSPCNQCFSEGLSMVNEDPQWIPTDQPPKLPDRVLEILDTQRSAAPSRVRLVENKTEKHDYYATLSHRWGGATLRTTKETYEAHILGLGTSQLPRTFQDAATVAHALGVKYLWIDSLCIIQDNPDDWLQQAAKMGSIYRNSTFTVAAHSAEQCNEGFLWRCQIPSSLSIAPQNGGQSFDLSLPGLTEKVMETAFFDSAISRRGWVLQELTLSPRILHFIEHQVRWECAHASLRSDTLNLQSTRGMMRQMWEPHTVHDAWLNLASRYSRYLLTKSEDKLVAINGVVEFLRETDEQASETAYHCGTFESDIGRSLLWYGIDSEIGKHLERAPSWSWASAKKDISFISLDFPESQFDLVNVKEILHEGKPASQLQSSVPYFKPPRTRLDEQGTSGRVTQPQCSITLEAPFFQITGLYNIVKAKHLSNVPKRRPRYLSVIEKDWGNVSYGWYTSEGDESLEKHPYASLGDVVSRFFLGIAKNMIDGQLAGIWCLVVEPVDGQKGVWRRIGFGHVRDIETIAPRLRERFTLTLV